MELESRLWSPRPWEVAAAAGGGQLLSGHDTSSVVRKMFLSLIEWVAQHREWTQCRIHFKMADFVMSLSPKNSKKC